MAASSPSSSSCALLQWCTLATEGVAAASPNDGDGGADSSSEVPYLDMLLGGRPGECNMRLAPARENGTKARSRRRQARRKGKPPPAPIEFESWANYLGQHDADGGG